MYKYYNIANLCAFPSIWEEPFALTCLEALVCGKPVVITKSGGMVEVVNENVQLFFLTIVIWLKIWLLQLKS